MNQGIDGEGSRLRRAAPALGAAMVLLVLGGAAARWIATSRNAPPAPRRVMQFTAVNLNPPTPPKAPPPEPKPVPKEEEPVQTTRVNLKPTDFQQPDLSRPQSAPGGGGRLSLAAEGSGPGDAFNLVGNPGGKGLLSGGGLGDGTELGEGGGGTGNRFGWYYARLASEIETAFRKRKELTQAATRVDLRVWAEPDGRISRIELIRSTGDEALDRAIQSVTGVRLSEPPPSDIPMPMIARLTARRVAQ